MLYPSPRSAEREPDDKIKTSRQPHRRGLPKSLRLDDRAESALGRCNLRGQITDFQYDAGGIYCAVVGAYRATIEGPRATSGSGRGFDCTAEACLCLRRIDPDYLCGCEQRRRSYDAAYIALADAGRAAVMAVSAVAIQGREPGTGQIVELRSGLEALVRHFGIREQRDAQSRNITERR